MLDIDVAVAPLSKINELREYVMTLASVPFRDLEESASDAIGWRIVAWFGTCTFPMNDMRDIPYFWFLQKELLRLTHRPILFSA